MNGRNDFRLRVRREETGYSVAGPGFYVWDDDRSVAIRAGLELEGGNLTGARAKRLLYYPDQSMPVPSTATSEALDV